MRVAAQLVGCLALLGRERRLSVRVRVNSVCMFVCLYTAVCVCTQAFGVHLVYI